MSHIDNFAFRRDVRNRKNRVAEFHENLVRHSKEHPENTALVPLCRGIGKFIEVSTEFWISLLDIDTRATDRTLDIKFYSGLIPEPEPKHFMTFHYEIADGIPSIVQRADEAKRIFVDYLATYPDHVWNFLFIPLEIYTWFVNEGWNFIEVTKEDTDRFTFVVLDQTGHQKVTLTFDFTVSKLDNDYMLSRISELNDD